MGVPQSICQVREDPLVDILSLRANFLQVQTSAEWPKGITHTTQSRDIKHGLPQKKSSTGKKVKNRKSLGKATTPNFE